MKGSSRIFTPAFFANEFVNLMLYVNYYVLMVVMAGYCLAAYRTDAGTAGFAASVFIVGALVARFVGGDRAGLRRIACGEGPSRAAGARVVGQSRRAGSRASR